MGEYGQEGSSSFGRKKTPTPAKGSVVDISLHDIVTSGFSRARDAARYDFSALDSKVKEASQLSPSLYFIFRLQTFPHSNDDIVLVTSRVISHLTEGWAGGFFLKVAQVKDIDLRLNFTAMINVRPWATGVDFAAVYYAFRKGLEQGAPFLRHKALAANEDKSRSMETRPRRHSPEPF